MALWRLATPLEFRSIGHLFGVARNTVCVITQQVCKAIKEELMTRFIQWPKGEALQHVTDGFEARGLPQCAGAIDGTHIPIIAPHKDPADYHNRKGWHSVNVQATCGHDFK